MALLNKKLDSITISSGYKLMRNQYRKTIEYLFYDKIGPKCRKFCASLNAKYGTNLNASKFGIASAKFAELYTIAGEIKSATFVGELPGNPAIVCMLMMTKDIKITSPQNIDFIHQDVTDAHKFDNAGKVNIEPSVSKFNDINQKIMFMFIFIVRNLHTI